MKNKLKYIVFSVVLAAIMTFTSCKDTAESFKPNLTGKSGSILIVINENHWETEIGTAFEKLLKTEQLGLPQAEPIFDVSRVAVSGFKRNYRTHRNIIMTKIDPEVEKPQILIKKDVWANQQMVLNILAPDVKSFYKLITDGGDQIVDIFLKAERDRLIQTYAKYADNEAQSKLLKKHNLSITIPKGYNYFQDTNSFIWIKRRNKQDIRQGIIIYYYDYTDTNTFTKDFLIKKRDYYLKKYLLGYKRGTYMATQMLAPVYFTEFDNNGRYTSELRGRWTLVNDFMGGPFVSFSQVDEKRGRVVTVEGYVYAPNENKRKFIREVESILWTLQFPD